MRHVRRPFVGVSLKMHLSHARTKSWLRDVAKLGLESESMDVAVLPGFQALEYAAEVLGGSAVAFGAQDCFWEDSGAFTGEVSPAALREIGCSYVEVGHAERRRIFGEDDETVARKAVAAQRHGMTPIVCIGEAHEGDAGSALRECMMQLDPVLDALSAGASNRFDVIVAYEPVWAIGAQAPAGATHIERVTSALRDHVRAEHTGIRIIYGGSAGPGLIARIPSVDGLFLGRSALDPARLSATVAEVAGAMACGWKAP